MHHQKGLFFLCSNSWISSEFHDFGANQTHAATDEADGERTSACKH